MDTNKILVLVLIIILLMVVINHIVIIKSTKTITTTTTTTNTKVVPVNTKQIGGCAGTRYGCCPNGSTPKANYIGSNC